MYPSRSQLSTLFALLIAALSTALAPGPLEAQAADDFVEKDANLARGFDANKAFDSSGIDSVNTFNGNLSLSIPLGLDYPIDGGFSFGLGVRYNSSVWDFKSYGYDDIRWGTDQEPTGTPDLCADYTQAWPSWNFNAGMGWELSLGRIFTGGPPEDTHDSQARDGVYYNSRQPTVYVDPSGARHEFFSTLHEGAPGTGSFPAYSRDGSYLRLDCTAFDGAGECIGLLLELPDGGSRTFEPDPRVPGGHGWRVKTITDAFGNYVRVDSYDAADDPSRPEWHLRDSQNREYYVRFLPQDAQAFGPAVVSEVDLPGVDGQRLLYQFHYSDVSIDRATRDTYPWGKTLERTDPNDEQLVVRRLTAIDLPDGTRYDMDYYGAGNTTSTAVRGLLRRVDLPLGGATEWTYGSYEFPTLQDCPPPGEPTDEQRLCSINEDPNTLSIGVIERRLLDSDNSLLGTWRYQHDLGLDASGGSGQLDAEGLPICGDRRILSTTVTDPLGHKTVSYYSGFVQGQDYGDFGWRRTEYGLPFRRDVQPDENEPLYLSSERLECVGTDCTPVSRTYVRYELDPTGLAGCEDGGRVPNYCGATNARVVADRTVYLDLDPTDNRDDEHHVDTVRSGFDGLGHYRTTVVTESNMPGIDSRTTFTDYDATGQTLTVNHAAGTASPFTPPSDWLLNIYSETRVTDEKVNEYKLTDRKQFDFDRQTGFLNSVRAFRNTEGSPPGSSQVDVITVFTPDTKGNPVTRERHGGENDRITGDLGAPEYRVEQTFQYGVLKTSKWENPTGTGETLSIVDNRSIDPSTGLVLSSADPTGLVTSYSYDTTGRLTDIEPTDDFPTRITYDLLSRPASVRVAREGATTSQGTEEEYVYDGLGRLTTERSRMPGGFWSEQVTAYLGDGSVAWVTDRHRTATAPRGYTENRKFDAFGRPTRVETPDGRTTEITFNGIKGRNVKSLGVARTLGSPADSALLYEGMDFAGRLAEVAEESDPATPGSTVKTTYLYDAGGRLTSVKTAGSGQVDRLFFYDGRGFLGSERHPEMATLPGNGLASVVWADYDSLGNPGRRTDADTDIAFEYDFAGRLVRTRDMDAGGRILTEHSYARMNRSDLQGVLSRNAGKLHQAKRFNYFPDREPVVITQTFEYTGPEGRLSRSSVRSAREGSPDVRFTQSYGYDGLGALTSHTYPGCEGPDRCSAPVGQRTVQRTFEHGLLRDVFDGSRVYASTIDYDANGLATSVARGNGVTDIVTVDPSGMPRPNRIEFEGASEPWDSGIYGYDGRGDIYAIGNDKYRYDAVGRLVEGQVLGGLKSQSITYDKLGNITQVTTSDRGTYSLPVQTSTNRLAESTVQYSPGGRLTGFRDRTITYDGLDRAIALQGLDANVRWAYDAAGERVALFDLMDGRETWTLRGPGHQVLRRYEGSLDPEVDPAWEVQDYIYGGSRLLATVDDGQLRHFHTGHLGTPRLVTGSAGEKITRHDYYPFGEEVFPDGAPDLRGRDETMRFTGHERDLNGEAGSPAIDDLDYMHARYFSPYYARFLTVDPVSGTPEVPQSWNRYAYVWGDPINHIDPNGEIVFGFSNEIAFYGFKVQVGRVNAANLENGIRNATSESAWFLTLGWPNPKEGDIGFGGGASGSAFLGSGDLDGFEGSGSSYGSGLGVVVGLSVSDETGDKVGSFGGGALIHSGASDTHTFLLRDSFWLNALGLQPRTQRHHVFDEITVRSSPLKIDPLPSDCENVGGICIEPIEIDHLDSIDYID